MKKVPCTAVQGAFLRIVFGYSLADTVGDLNGLHTVQRIVDDLAASAQMLKEAAVFLIEAALLKHLGA